MREICYISLDNTLRSNASGGTSRMYKIKRQQGPRHTTMQVSSWSALERYILIKMVTQS